MSRKRVGIVTFHNADNLGAVLQAYALQEVLTGVCGVQARVIDYRCGIIERGRYGSAAGRLRGLPKSVYYAVKRRGFDRFRRQYLSGSRAYTRETISECVPDYDLFITGSDQVWNLECSGWDMTYFLDFVPAETPKYSYAASIGNYRFSPEEQPGIRTLLGRFQAISVRERSAHVQLGELGISQAALCPDPVVLLTADQWKKRLPRRLCGRKYILLYQIQPDVRLRRYARAYAAANHCKIIDNKKSLDFILHNSPDEFLSWIYYADCVFTNSFHATSFSLIFGKPLGAEVELTNGGRNPRVMEMLERCHGQGCILREQWQPAAAEAREALASLRKEGLTYLREICAGAGSGE